MSKSLLPEPMGLIMDTSKAITSSSKGQPLYSKSKQRTKRSKKLAAASAAVDTMEESRQQHQHQSSSYSCSMVNQPAIYVTSSEAAYSNFMNPLPHVVGYKKYHFLGQAIYYNLHMGEPVECYLTGIPTLTFWHMMESDVSKINSITYDLTCRRSLFGHINYLPDGSYRAFHVDNFTEFFDQSGSLIPRSAVPRSLVEDMKARVTLKIAGLSEDMCHGVIEPMITVHRVVLTSERRLNLDMRTFSGGDTGGGAGGAGVGSSGAAAKPMVSSMKKAPTPIPEFMKDEEESNYDYAYIPNFDGTYYNSNVETKRVDFAPISEYVI